MVELNIMGHGVLLPFFAGLVESRRPGSLGGPVIGSSGNPKHPTMRLDEICWPSAPPDWWLHPRPCQVWAFPLDVTKDSLELLHSILMPEERERAAKFRFDRDRNRFVVGRGSLRTILGRYLQLEPDQVQLSYGAYGKPFLSSPG